MITQITNLMILSQILSGCGENTDVCKEKEQTDKKRGGKVIS